MKWFCPSVCPSACPSVCSLIVRPFLSVGNDSVTITVKAHMHTLAHSLILALLLTPADDPFHPDKQVLSCFCPRPIMLLSYIFFHLLLLPFPLGPCLSDRSEGHIQQAPQKKSRVLVIDSIPCCFLLGVLVYPPFTLLPFNPLLFLIPSHNDLWRWIRSIYTCVPFA